MHICKLFFFFYQHNTGQLFSRGKKLDLQIDALKKEIKKWKERRERRKEDLKHK
jgi:hypothetical protein